jgi:glycosyltransferase involved in cell wall biosynthesis
MKNNKPIRVLHLIRDFNIGGVETAVIRLANNLADKVEFFGIIGRQGYYLNNRPIDSKIKIFTRIKNQYNIVYFFFNLYYILKISSDNNINIIHYHFRLYIPYIFSIKLFRPKTNIIYTHHSTFNDLLRNYIFADYYLPISEKHKANLINNIFLKNNYSVIPNGVEITEKIFLNNNLLKNIGFVGRFDKIKGLEFLVNTFYKYSEKLYDYNLVIRGDGELNKATIEIIKSLPNIKIERPKSEIHEIYKDIGIIIIPSSAENNATETFPNLVMLEAMSLKIPVICPDCITIDNKFINNHNIIIYKANNSIDLIDKIITLSTNLSLVKTITQNAYDTIKENYSIQKYSQSILQVYYKFS